MKRCKKIIAFLLVLGMVITGIPVLSNAKMYTPEASGKSVAENEQMIIDYSNASMGYVMVKYKLNTSSKIKSQVQCPSGTTYTYNVTPGRWEVFPLSEGDGSYKVSVFKNISGTSYSVSGSTSFTATLKNKLGPYLYTNQYVNYNSNTKCVKKAKKLCKNKKTEMDKVKAVYKWTIKYFKYDTEKARTVQSGYLPDLNKVYSAKKGICFDYAATMTAMLRSLGIPTKLVIGYAGDAYHAWISVYSAEDGWLDNVIFFDGEEWNLMDPTFASSSNESPSVMKYIGDGNNYKAKYAY